MEKQNIHRVNAVAMNPQTGEVLAMTGFSHKEGSNELR